MSIYKTYNQFLQPHCNFICKFNVYHLYLNMLSHQQALSSTPTYHKHQRRSDLGGPPRPMRLVCSPVSLRDTSAGDNAKWCQLWHPHCSTTEQDNHQHHYHGKQPSHSLSLHTQADSTLITSVSKGLELSVTSSTMMHSRHTSTTPTSKGGTTIVSYHHTYNDTLHTTKSSPHHQLQLHGTSCC